MIPISRSSSEPCRTPNVDSVRRPFVTPNEKGLGRNDHLFRRGGLAQREPFLEARDRDPALAAIPVVAATASGVKNVGANVLGVMAKPLDVPALLAIARRTCTGT